VSHRVIGVWYLVVSISSGFLGFVLSVFVRLECSVVSFCVLFGDFHLYSCIVSVHGLVMVFGFIMPVLLGGFGNFCIPLCLGVCDLVLPRLNCVALWFYVLGVFSVLLSSVVDEGIGVG
jgi:heme/copper-type cytochrome/quinol oxidase subunit 1